MIVSLTSNSSHEIYFCMTFDLTMMKIEHCPFKCSHLFVSEHFIHTHTLCVCVSVCFLRATSMEPIGALSLLFFLGGKKEKKAHVYYFSSNSDDEQNKLHRVRRCNLVIQSVGSKKNHSFSANVWKASGTVKSASKSSQRNFKKSR